MAFDLKTLVPGVLSWFGGEQQNRRQAEAAEAANTFSAQQFATRYQTTTSDMKAAGLNPMLAYTQGGGSPPSGVQANVPANSGRAAVEGYQIGKINAAQTANIEADTANKAAQAELWRAQAGAATASAGQATATVGQIQQATEKIKKEIENMPSGMVNGLTVGQWNTDILRRTAEMLKEQAFNYSEQGHTQEQQRDYLRQMAAKLVQDARLGKLDADAAEKFDNFGREYKQYEPIIQLLKSVLGRK